MRIQCRQEKTVGTLVCRCYQPEMIDKIYKKHLAIPELDKTNKKQGYTKITIKP